MKPRALTYTEMMNGGRQQMDEAEHVREQQLQQQVEDLEKDVDRLENHFRAVSKAPVRNWWLKKFLRLKNSDLSSVVSAGENYAIFFIA